MREAIARFRLSPQQRHLWRLQQGSPTYRSQCSILLEGAVDLKALENALCMIVKRHEIFRTTFELQPGMKTALQVVSPTTRLSFHTFDLTDLEAESQAAEIENLFRKEGRIEFPLNNGPLVRFKLLVLSETKRLLLLNLPSLCADSRTLKTLAGEIARAYDACLRGEQSLDSTIQYVQFSEWQNQIAEGQNAAAGIEYWRSQQMKGWSTSVLPLEQAQTSSPRFKSAFHSLELDPALAASLEQLANKRGKLLSDCLLAAWQTFLWRLTLGQDIVTAVLCDGRIYDEMNAAMGLYERWPLIRTRFESDYRFTGILDQVEAASGAAREWQEYFSWELFEPTSQDNLESLFPLVGFDYHEWPEVQTASGVRFSLYKLYSLTERFKLKLSCAHANDLPGLELQYDTAFYSEQTIRLHAERFKKLLQGVSGDPGAPVGNLEIVADSERRQMISLWNDTQSGYPRDLCIHQMFEAQVARTPDALALEAGAEHLSYGDLNRRANQLARHLLTLGVGPESLVALCAERSVEMIVGLLGALKAGAAYVPLDPRQSRPRLAFMLEDIQPHIALTQRHLAHLFQDQQGKLVRIDADWEAIEREREDNPANRAISDNLAYVIFTSGSTGKPKGVMIEHRSVANLATALLKSVYANQTEPLRVSVNAPLAFDASVKQIIQLLSGHSLHLIPEEVRPDGKEMLAFIERQMLGVLDCTPSQLQLLIEAGLCDKASHAPTIVLVGGEALDESAWARLVNHERANYFNVYGPTECTVDSTICRLSAQRERPSIGGPIANVKTYVLDDSLNPAPIGVPGELLIGGEGLARGYLNRPDITAETFVPDPFDSTPGMRLYKTGDLVSHLPDGAIEFLGRKDFQVKIRGSRIEMGEIESVIEQHPLVRKAAVVAREDAPGDKRLVAYVVSKQRFPSLTRELRGFARERLPEYMLPSAFVTVEEFPLTRNGKIDRQALPAPDQARPEMDEAFTTPRTFVEEALSGIWESLLGVDRVGLKDNFFVLGGHSLLATQIISHARKVFQVEIALRSLFDAPTVEGLARHIELLMRAEQGLQAPPIKPVPRGQGLPLSFSQQRLWFLHQLDPESSAYNLRSAYRLKGELDLRALERSFGETIRRHEALRTTFKTIDGQPVQVISEPLPINFVVEDFSSLDPETREARALSRAAAEAGKGFDLERGPLVRATALKLGEVEHIVMLTMHHIISDGWSTGLLMNELITLYRYFSAGRPSPLEELEIQYADYAVWQREWLQGEALERQLSYWKKQLSGAPPVIKLPTDRPRSEAKTNRGAVQAFELGESVAEGLKILSRTEGVTLFMSLLASFQALLRHYSGQDDIVVGAPIANRNRVETEGLIGCLVNALALRAKFDGDTSFRRLLAQVREVTLAAYAHQDLPFEKVVEELKIERSNEHTPVFQVAFSFQNARPGSPDEVVDEVMESEAKTRLEASPLELTDHTAKYDLVLDMFAADQRVTGSLQYNMDIFNASTIARMAGRFQTILQSAVLDPDIKLKALDEELAEANRRQRLSERNRVKESRRKMLENVKMKSITGLTFSRH